MKIKSAIKAFTLIELLVVITIIGILATGATAVYTSQIQKARDTTRLNDITALQAWIEQAYQDKWTYPNAWLAIAGIAESFKTVTTYTPKLPIDPKTNQKSTNSNFDYTYWVASDSSWIWFQIYEISTTFENSWTISSKAVWDWWTDNNRLEIWIGLDTLLTPLNLATPPATWVSGWVPVAASCVSTAWTVAANCPTTNPNTTANTATLVIR